MKKIIATFFVVFLTACQSAPQKTRALPNVTIENVTKQEVMDLTVRESALKGVNLVSANDYQLVFQREGDFTLGNAFATALVGSRTNKIASARMTYTYTPVPPNSVLVSARAEMVIDPGTAWENAIDATESHREEIKQSLERMKQRFN